MGKVSQLGHPNSFLFIFLFYTSSFCFLFYLLCEKMTVWFFFFNFYRRRRTTTAIMKTTTKKTTTTTAIMKRRRRRRRRKEMPSQRRRRTIRKVPLLWSWKSTCIARAAPIKSSDMLALSKVSLCSYFYLSFCLCSPKEEKKNRSYWY